MRQSIAAASAAAFAAIVVASGAAADILIVSSTTPELKPGMQLADSARLDVPAGAKVRVLLPSGATLQINGASSRLVKEITRGEPLVESVWAKAKELLTTGGVDQSRTGAVRSFTPPPPAVQGFSWTLVGTNASGNVCVERGERLSVERPASRAADITIIDTARNTRAVIGFAGDATKADWPTTLPPSTDTTYQIVAANSGVRQIKLRLIDKAGTSEAAALRTLLDNDCRAQARAWAKG